MNMYILISATFYLIFLDVFTVNSVIADDKSKKLNEDISNTALDEIYNELDDNHNGEIDVNEAEKFIQDKSDIKTAFLQNKAISREFLWRNWKQSPVNFWTKDIVILWLIYEVRLAQYSDRFLLHNVNGSTIPKLSLPDHSYLKKSLKITDASDCFTIAFKAKQLILFGVSKEFIRRFPPKDLAAYSIISNLHNQLDDDKDGGVTENEADEFARDELKYTEDFDRAKTFNKDDKHVSKEELWYNWKSSEVYNWTVEDVINWLCNHVELCEYASSFSAQNIDGSIIPSLAQSDMSFLTKDLKIRNPVHRKKIILKATDLILFGSPKNLGDHSRAKDSILVTLLLLTIGGCWLAYHQHRYSKKQIKDLQQQMKQLGIAENSLSTLQNKLELAEQMTDKVSTEKQEIEDRLRLEIEKYKEDLNRTESSDDLKSKVSSSMDEQSDHKCHFYANCDGMTISDQMRILLQITYEMEGSFFFYKRMAALQQMENVKEMCEKIRKKKGTVMGAFRIAHSTFFDDVEKQLLDARLAIDQVKSDLIERSQRWKTMEKLMNIPLLPTPGIEKLRMDLAKASSNEGLSMDCRRHSHGHLLHISNEISNTTTSIVPAAAAIPASITSTTINSANDIAQRPRSLLLDGTMDHQSLHFLPKVASVHENLSSSSASTLQKHHHLYTAASPCCSSHFHSCGASGIPSSCISDAASAQAACLAQSTSLMNMNCNNTSSTNTSNNNHTFSKNYLDKDKIRPFAFRWMRKSKKS